MEAIAKIANTIPDTEVRVCRRLDLGDVLHQGDVYLHRVADDHPRGAELGTRKVAVGEGEGSNHIVEGHVCVYRGAKFPPAVDASWARENPDCLRPVVVADEECVVTHPKHSHHRIPSGVYQVTYQRDEATRQRVVD